MTQSGFSFVLKKNSCYIRKKKELQAETADCICPLPFPTLFSFLHCEHQGREFRVVFKVKLCVRYSQL